MACMDCYECSYHVDNGGTCDKMEYDCPYRLFFRFGDESIKINKAIVDLHMSLEQLNIIFKNYKEDISDYFPSLVIAINDAIDLTSDYNEYKNMIEKYNDMRKG